MKKVFTKVYSLVLLTLVGWAFALTAQAQTFTESLATGGTDDRVTALTTDKDGNVWAIVDPTGATTSLLVEYVKGLGSPVQKDSGIPISDSSDGATIASLASDSHGNIYLSTNNAGTAAIIYKYTASSSYARSPLVTGSVNIGYFEAICIGPDDNLYVVQYNLNGNTAGAGVGDFEIARYSSTTPTTNTSSVGGTPLYTDLDHGFFAGYATTNHNYSHIVGMQVDKNLDIYVADGFDENVVYSATNGSNIYKLIHGTTYSLGGSVAANLHATALAMDATRTNLYASVSLTHTSTYSVVEYTGGVGTTQTPLYTGLTVGSVNYPFGLAYVSDSELYAGDGEPNSSNINNLDIIYGAPTTQASNVSFSSISTTAATASWTISTTAAGGGSTRAVFINQTSSTSSTPSPSNNTAYNAAVGAYINGTQAGSGWYCVYNGTGTSTSISGLASGTAYRVAVVEYNGTTGSQNYLTTAGTGNPANFTTLTPTITVPGGTVTVTATTTGTAGSSVSFNISGANLSGNLTATAPTNFQVSSDNSSWNTTATITQSGGTITNAPVYVRLSGSGSVGTQSGNVALSGGSATTANQAVSGSLNTPSTTISSLTAVTGTTTNAASVQYTATFAASITGLSTSDFTLNTTGVSGASVSSVSGSGTSWTVTVNTGSGSGTVQLVMNSSSGVSPLISNLPLSGSTYTIDKTAPTVSSITAASPSNASPTNATSVTYTVTFSEAVTGVDATDFALTTSGTSGSVSGVSGSGTTYTVTVSSISGNGTLRLDLKSSGTGITDAAGNAISGGFTSGGVYTIDQTAPTVSSITATTPSNASPINATSVTYTVTFSEAVTGVDATDFALTTSGTSGSVSGVSGSGTTYTVTVSSISGTGTLRLDLKSSGTGITDAAGNAISGGFTSGGVYTIDQTAPTVSSITATSPSNASPTNATSVTYTVTFSEAVTGVDNSDFTFTSGGAFPGGLNVTPVSSSVYTVVVSSIGGNGTLRLDLKSSGTGITDVAGNAISGGFTGGDIYTFDHTAPTVSSIAASNPLNTNPTNATTLTYNVNFSEPVTGVDVSDFTLTTSGTSGSVTNVSGSGANYAVTVSSVTGNGTLRLDLNSSGTGITDVSGNAISGGFTGGDVYTIDNTAPTVSSITATTPSNANPTNATSVSYTVTFSEAVTGVGTTSFTATRTNTVTSSAIVVTPVSSSVYTVTVNGISGDGTLRLDLNSSNNGVLDRAGNPISGGFTGGDTYTIDNTAPTVSSIAATTPANTNPTNATSVTYTVGFSEPVTGVDASDFTLTTSGTSGSITGVSGSGTTYTVTVSSISGTGTLRLDLNSSGTGITDVAGNAISGGFTSGDVYTIDNTVPTVSSITATTPANTNPTNATSVTYTVTFSKTVTGVDASDFAVTTSGTSGSVTGVSGSGSSYTVTVSSISGNGTLRLDLNSSGTGITDVAGNAISGGFTTGDVYTIDNTAPTVSSITATSPSNTNPTNSTSVSYTVTFSEAVTGVSNAAFAATATNTVVSTGITVTPVSSSVYIVTVNGISGDGTLRLDLNSSGTGIADVAGNAISSGFTSGDIYTIDNTAPTLTHLVYSSSNPNGSFATTGDVITLTFGTNEFIQTPSLSIAGHSITATYLGGDNYSASYTMTSGDTEGRIHFALTVTDLAGNPSNYNDVAAGDNITFDMTAPTIGISAPSVTSIAAGGSGTVTYTVTYGDANFNTSKLITGNITLNKTGTANGTVGLTGSGTSYTVTISGITGGGTLGISIAAGTASDLAGNFAPASAASATFNVLSNDASLSNLGLSSSGVTPKFSPTTTSYTVLVNGTITSFVFTPTTTDPGATITVNGTAVTSGTASAPVPVNNLGNNFVSIVVTAADGHTKRTYTVNVDKVPYQNARLTYMVLSAHTTISPVFAELTTSYTATVPNIITSLTLTPTAEDPNAMVIKVNGTTVTSGTASAPIALNIGRNTISTTVTAQDGSTTKTYTIVVTRLGSEVVHLSYLVLSNHTPISPVFAPTTTSYTASVANSISSLTITPTLTDTRASVTVNGTTVASGTASGPIALSVGPNTISTTVTAQDQTTSLTYTVVVTRAAPSSHNSVYQETTSVTTPADNVTLESDVVVVHQGLSPNGDGINDFLMIDGIANHPDNKLQIMNRSGQLVFEARGYDNSSKVFDGHSNKNGQMQLPGTYFYSLDYTEKGETKHKTGFIVLKY